MLNLYIRTRGLRIDYHFLLKQPPKIPSPNDYRSDIEQPTCILERTQENPGYIFLSGIPSSRKDYQGTPIYYDFIATWKNNDVEYPKELTKLISIWLHDVKEALQHDGNKSYRVRLPIAKNSDLGKLLDQTLPSEYVEELLQLTVDSNELEDKKKNLDKKLEKFISEIPAPNDLAEAKRDESKWWGGVNNENSCKEWIKLVEKLLQGETYGKALLLNIATPKSLNPLSVNNQELGVLLAKEWSGSNPNPIKSQDAQENSSNVDVKGVKDIAQIGESILKRGSQDIDIVKKKAQELFKKFPPGSDY